MAIRRVFLLSGSQLTVYHWRAGALGGAQVFAADEDGLTQFSTYLDSMPSEPAWMLVDIVEEEFREDTVPHVYATDRRVLLRTKAHRLFRDARYTHALFQGRETEGRRDDRVLFTALIRPDLLAPWLGQVARHKVPLAGIYSLSILSERLLKHVPGTATRALLVTLSGNGGLRQTFFRDGQIKLSRLAIMPDLGSGQRAALILAEVEKIRRYLNSLRLLSRETPLDVHVLGHGSVIADLARTTSDTVVTRHHFVDTATVARAIGFKGVYDSPDADALFVHLLARQQPRNFYARPEETRYFSLYRARRGIKAASVLIFLASLGWSGYQMVNGAIAEQDARTLAHKVDFYERIYREARGQLPKTKVEPIDLQRTVEAVRTLAARRTTPAAMMEAISEGLGAYPSLKLARLEWRVSDDPDAPIAGTNPIRFETRTPAATPDKDALYQLALIEGEVQPFDGNYRAAIEAVNGLAVRLAALKDVSAVRVVELPLDLSSRKNLSGGTGGRIGEARFKLRLALRVRHAPSVANRGRG